MGIGHGWRTATVARGQAGQLHHRPPTAQDRPAGPPHYIQQLAGGQLAELQIRIEQAPRRPGRLVVVQIATVGAGTPRGLPSYWTCSDRSPPGTTPGPVMAWREGHLITGLGVKG